MQPGVYATCAGRLSKRPCDAGFIGELTSRRADIALTQLTATSYREASVDQTFSVIDARMALMVHADTLRPTGE